ncbi:hypothetical protein GCM10009821_20080 [Aeromicrobium halocynthiae]|uniref:DUF222 domain-containing protein n=1 Tax=Aeromicrobium halocynthiae TaxID=560557 RepID=A0ABN2W1I3_9ACTN
MSSHTSCTQDHCRRGDGAYCPTAEQLPAEVIAQRQALLDARDAAEQKLLDFEAKQAFAALQGSSLDVGSMRIAYGFEGEGLVPVESTASHPSGRPLSDAEIDDAYSLVAPLVSEEASHIAWRRSRFGREHDAVVVRPVMDDVE